MPEEEYLLFSGFLGLSAVKKPHKCTVTAFTDVQPQLTRQYWRSTTRPSRSAPERGVFAPGGLLTL